MKILDVDLYKPIKNSSDHEDLIKSHGKIYLSKIINDTPIINDIIYDKIVNTSDNGKIVFNFGPEFEHDLSLVEDVDDFYKRINNPKIKKLRKKKYSKK